FADVNEYTSSVYANPSYIQTLETSTPISDHVKVDLELQGCPVNKYQLLEVLNALLNNRRPNLPDNNVCMDCKLRGNSCVMVLYGMPCLGPVTLSGCNALCPSFRRGCFGCYGPVKNADPRTLTETLKQKGAKTSEIIPLYRNFNAWSETFRKESIRLEQGDL
ncbi:MAG: oxidoreductase, partial [Spirochaetia bacterium]|nr:oxidoreductase [Spirochaetia bacterium]